MRNTLSLAALVVLWVGPGCGQGEPVALDAAVDARRPIDGARLDAPAPIAAPAPRDAPMPTDAPSPTGDAGCPTPLRSVCGLAMRPEGATFECGTTYRPPAGTAGIYEQSPDVLCTDTCTPFGDVAVCCNFATGTLVECSYSAGACDECRDVMVCPPICVR